MDGNDADQMNAFMAVLQTGSFSAAGRKLGRDGSVISRRVASLVSRLGLRLLERSTRRISPTEAGMRFHDRAKEALDLLGQAEEDARSAAAMPTGLLRVSVPLGFGRLWVAPFMPAFLARYPSLRVEVNYTDRYVDRIEEGFDAGVRIGKMDDNRLVAKRIANMKRVLCASPAYLSNGTPLVRPEDLLHHNCIGFTPLFTHPVWHFKGKGDHAKRQSVRIDGRMVTDDIEAARQAGLAGTGIFLAADWAVSRELKDGRLVCVLNDWVVLGDEQVHVVRASRRHEAAKTRVFVDWIAAVIGQNPWD